VRTFIEREQPGLVLCGHIHESRALDQFDGTTIANPGPTAAGHYAIVETGDHLTVEFDA
jgi:uncharacterized protein